MTALNQQVQNNYRRTNPKKKKSLLSKNGWRYQATAEKRGATFNHQVVEFMFCALLAYVFGFEERSGSENAHSAALLPMGIHI